VTTVGDHMQELAAHTFCKCFDCSGSIAWFSLRRSERESGCSDMQVEAETLSRKEAHLPPPARC
jgi:hypothetical protein